MDNYRLVLAAIALALAIMFAAVWWYRGRQRSPRTRGALIVYSLLLLCSAFLLYSRSSEPLVAQKSDRPNPSAEVKSPVAAEQESGSDHKADAGAKEERARQETLQQTPTSSSSDREGYDSDHRDHAASLSSSRDFQLVYGPPERPLPKRKGSGARSGQPEEVIEAAVLHAFDIIELFFETHATPVVQANSNPGAAAGTAIEFLPGTAQLSDHSRRYLESLAPALEKQCKSGRLEIRAQTNEKLGSPAMRFSLTQSRAEAVAEILTSGGFPADRLIAIGSESANQTSVSFVHRPN
ncbi:MAG: OmpA family protein [Calditrichaeota bacterium]|nr:OmpA family protein [Calditrichota bacterium]MCB9366468.1 OmpA family protein [Calditrichota bacterium]MCB9391274.1 OmpA family protein [Calditrichota bacterium]